MARRNICDVVWETSNFVTEPLRQGLHFPHYNDVIMGVIASQITSLTIVFSTVYSDADHRKHQSPASLVPGEFPVQMASNAENVSI